MTVNAQTTLRQFSGELNYMRITLKPGFDGLRESSGARLISTIIRPILRNKKLDEEARL